MTRRWLWLPIVAIAGFAHAAGAATVPAVTVTLQVGEDPATVLYPTGAPTTNPDQFTFDGSYDGEEWELTWDMTVDVDPFVSGNFTVLNNTDDTQTYTFIVTLPIAPAVTPSSLVGGSIGVTVTDSNFDGVGTVSSAGGGTLYTGVNDLTDTIGLLGPGFSLSVPFAGGSNTTSASTGLPGPTIPGPAALATISIRHTFTLTPGDSAALTSFYVVEVVPEPTTLLLVSLGLAGLTAAGRRRVR